MNFRGRRGLEGRSCEGVLSCGEFEGKQSYSSQRAIGHNSINSESKEFIRVSIHAFCNTEYIFMVFSLRHAIVDIVSPKVYEGCLLVNSQDIHRFTRTLAKANSSLKTTRVNDM